MALIINSKPIVTTISQSPEPILFETVKIDKFAQNLTYHQRRIDLAYKNFFKSQSLLNLEQILQNAPSDKIYRAKIIYNKDGLQELNYYPYKRKTVNSIALIEAPNIDYKYKYLKREIFEKLSIIYKADEYLITQNGFLTDTTIANIALFDANSNLWHTPKRALLKGTTRQRYLEQKRIEEKEIHYKDLKNYSKIALLNAMVDWQELNLY